MNEEDLREFLAQNEEALKLLQAGMPIFEDMANNIDTLSDDEWAERMQELNKTRPPTKE
jgi:hypothetical protein